VAAQPNYDDFSCQWKFNREPPPLEEDEAVMVPCFANVSHMSNLYFMRPKRILTTPRRGLLVNKPINI